MILGHCGSRKVRGELSELIKANFINSTAIWAYFQLPIIREVIEPRFGKKTLPLKIMHGGSTYPKAFRHSKVQLQLPTRDFQVVKAIADRITRPS